MPNPWDNDPIVAPASRGTLVTLPPSPKQIAEQARQAAAERRAEEAARRSAAAEARATRDEARRAREWEATHNPDGSPKAKAQGSGKPMPDSVARRYEEAINSFAALDRAIGGFKDDYAGNTLTGELENKAQRLLDVGTEGQADWWADFAATDNMIRNALFGASLTGGEKAAYAKTTVTPSMAPAEVKRNLQRRRELARDVLSRRTNFLRNNGYDPDAISALAGEYGQELGNQAQQRADNEVTPLQSKLLPLQKGGGGGPDGLASGRDDQKALIASPEQQAEHEAYLTQHGRNLDPDAYAQFRAALDIKYGATVTPADVESYREWARGAREGVKAGGILPVKIPPGKTNMSGTDKLQSLLSNNPLGAAAARYTNAATAGTVGALAGEDGQAALAALAQQYPKSALAGDIVGGVTGAGALELGAARLAAPALARYAPRIADLVYGGVSGANNAEEGEGLTGALTGAAVGMGGGYVGQRAMQGLSSGVRGVTDEAVQGLRQRGVPLTIGQAVSQSGPLGRGIKGVEDALTSVPFIGNMVDARRREGLEAFNRAAFNEGGAPIGATVNDIGAEGIQELADARTQAYRQALDPVTIDATDPDLINDLGAAINMANAIPNVNGAQDAALAGLRSRMEGAVDPATDTISGRGFQEAYRGLARTGRERAGGDYGHEVGQTMRQGQDALAGALERQNPGAFDQFRAANDANRRLMVLSDAVNRAKNADDEIFFPSQLNMADAASTRRLSGPLASAAGDRPFFGLARDGQAVLPSKLGDSGTATRAMVGVGLTGGLGGAGYALDGGEGATTGTGLGLGTSIALALGGTRGAQNAATRILLDRPDIALPIAEEINRRARIGGLGLGSYLSNLVTGP